MKNLYTNSLKQTNNKSKDNFKVFHSKKICAQKKCFKEFQTIKVFLIIREIPLQTYLVLVIILFPLSQMVIYPHFPFDGSL